MEEVRQDRFMCRNTKDTYKFKIGYDIKFEISGIEHDANDFRITSFQLVRWKTAFVQIEIHSLLTFWGPWDAFDLETR